MSDVFFKLKVLCWHLQEAFTIWQTEVWRRNLDEWYCCPGTLHDQCGCGGVTVRELWSYEHSATTRRERDE